MTKKNFKSEPKEEVIGQSFLEVVSEKMSERRIGVHHLAKSTGIPKNYLEALVNGDFENLPAAPYVRGYLKQIAPLIEYDSDKLWDLYKIEASPKISGSSDKLPSNRFELERGKSNKLIIIALIFLVAITYLFINGSSLIGQPFLELDGFETDTKNVFTEEILVRGRIDPDDTLSINNEIVEINELGSFEVSYPLEEGLNSIVFRVRRFLGKEIEIVRHVFYEPQTMAEPSTN